MPKTSDELIDEYAEQFTGEIDRQTLTDGISRKETANIYRALAGEFRHRADLLEAEADGDGE